MQQQLATDYTLEIAQQALFQTLPVDAVAEICAQGIVVNFKDGEVLIRENKVNFSLFLILQGQGKVMMNGTQVAMVSGGEIIGEISVSRTSMPLASVIAQGELRVLVFPAIVIQDLMVQYEAFSKMIKKMALARVYNPS
ncbi:MAG: cyclic nucleotide-binding domain-containing protein [Ghiorsea sp.]